MAYAQNFEDVLLWRTLGHVENGRYVDVGAHDPDLSSVTRLFYEQGWRGINIEPVPTMAERLRARRPDDVTLQVACSDSAGEVTFFEVPDTGLSTLDANHAAELRGQQWTVVEHPTPVTTLDTVLETYPTDPIHFLKIDVEGGEASVLAGCDLRRWRPWVVVIEATAPLSQRIVSDAWEPMVLAAGYARAYFDGLNLYFVADEHAELAESLRLQPNCFDGFALAADHVLVDHTELDALRRDLDGARALVSDFEELARSTEEWAKSTEAQLTMAETQAATDRRIAAEATATLAAMKASRSWKITAPLRGATSAARSARSVTRAVVSPALTAGLHAVRRNDSLKRSVRSALARFPQVEARFQSFANARPDQKDDAA